MNKSTNLYIKFIIFSLVAVVVTAVTWRSPSTCIALLVALSYIKQIFAPINKSLLTFIIFGLAGTTMESLIMLRGPWSYAIPHLFNFPIWLPFLWGLAGTLSITLYQAISKIS